jgi:hydrogenase/urease accessory protein HupE
MGGSVSPALTRAISPALTAQFPCADAQRSAAHRADQRPAIGAAIRFGHDRRGGGEIARAYVVLGIGHILSGIDHLLFVAGLLFLVGFRPRLIGTISAFTLAHSVTLGCSVFGLIALRLAPVEAAIAMSIVLVASEALRERDTLARRLPALVSFLFGLVHGLGFAGALKSVGLPQKHLPLALLSFNAGVKLGQLLTALVTFAIVRLPVSQRWLARARRPALYAIGITAAYWSWLRIATVAVAAR